MSDAAIVGLVLAGGQSRRLRREKSWRKVGGVPMIERVLAAVAAVVGEVIVVGGERAPAGARLVADDSPGAGPLAAIYTGMKAASADVYLVAACDMPFVTSELLRHLLVASRGFDAVVPVVGGRDQPLCAAYTHACLPAIVEALATGGGRVADFFPKVRLRRLDEAAVEQFGPPEVLFFNVNTPEELTRAQQIALGSNA